MYIVHCSIVGKWFKDMGFEYSNYAYIMIMVLTTQ